MKCRHYEVKICQTNDKYLGTHDLCVEYWGIPCQLFLLLCGSPLPQHKVLHLINDV